MDQLRAMSVFVAVVDRGSFAGAADHLGLSRTAASKHVMDLEAHIGATLLNRTTRRLSLTGPGTAYYERAKQILELVEAADGAAAMETQTPRGRLRVSAPMSFGIRHLAPRLTGYLDAYPEVGIDLVLNDRLVDLVEEGFDLTIRIGRLADSSLMVRRLASSRLVLCAAESYLRERGRPAHPLELAEHACLGYPYWSGQDAWHLRSPDGAQIRVPVETRLWSNNGDALLNAAVAGAGIILQPDFIVHDALRRGELVEILSAFAAPEVGIHAVFAQRAFLPLRVRTFIDYLARSFSDDLPWADGT